MDVVANMTCSQGGEFYACGEGSRFVGCCASDPCSVGCAAGNLKTTSFDTAQYGQIPDQHCSTGLFYTCNFTTPAFWGCCTTSACAGSQGCAATALAGAFLSTNTALAAPFLALNETWEGSDQGTATDQPADPVVTADSSSSSNTGTVAGGVVGGIAGLALILLGFLWLYRRQRRRAGAPVPESTEDSGKAQVQELSHDASTAVGLKELPPNWTSSPSMPSYHSSPEFQNGEWSPRPPSYYTNDPRAKSQHMSYELPGSQAGVEMDAPRGVMDSKLSTAQDA
ncbi:hypothetical protein Slin15195_G010380 [Septoria linicola]|uniref:Uncharacterized protein n=1 Tax=Septoria linicola TaxID=215465 RepID=A0A9Q9ADW8_9PEZI|nr:hypothetical protein Slin14017_G010390 [Septoria linicola]USW47719.1 hypothetical protein Slin15195_G010380 [Septoria linicola]